MKWSYSFLKDYTTCPKKAYHKYIARDIPKETSRAAAWGNEIHTALENAIKKPDAELAENAKQYAPLVRQLPPSAKAELALGVTREGAPTSFYADDVWGRGKLDVAIVFDDKAILFDWKTGKVREEPLELEIQALLLQAHYPKVKKIIGHYVWLKDNRLGQPFDVSDTASVWYRVNLWVNEAETRKEFPPVKNPLCGWCPVKQCPLNPRK